MTSTPAHATARLLPSPTLNRFAAWLALVAMLLNALWPVIANARPAEAGIPFEICTPQGIKKLTSATDAQVAQDEPPGQPVAKHPGPHCPFCMGANDSPAIHSASAASFDAPRHAARGIVTGPLVFHPTATPLPAQPRGPPAHS